MKKRLFSVFLTICLIVTLLPTSAVSALADGTGTKANPFVIYRNPTEDYAGDSISASSTSEALQIITQFYARSTTQQAWKEQIISQAAAAGFNTAGADDVYYYVETASLGYVSITSPKYIVFVPLNCGYWFGWSAAKGGAAGVGTESKVRLVDSSGNYLTEDFYVKVKGYVDVSWSIGDGSSSSTRIALNTAVTSHADYNTASDSARAYASQCTADSGGNIIYTFLGWDADGDGDYDNADETILSSVIDVTSDNNCIAAEDVDNTTLQAVYDITYREYTVTWQNADGAVLETDTGVTYGSTPVYNGSTPVKNADAQYTYTFSGWDSNNDGVVDELTSVAGDITYAAVFASTVNSYTVTWKDDAGDVLRTEDLAYGSIPSYGSEPAKANPEAGVTYTFLGWDANGDSQADALTAVTGDMTYTALWTSAANIYTVTFNENDGSEVADARVEHGNTVSAPDTTRDGYRFDGWYTDVDCTSAYDFSAAVTGNITLYAKWVQQITVTFDTTGGSGVASQTIDVGGKAAQPTEPAKTGYVFDGWYSDASCTTPYDFDTTINSDTTVYAKWLTQYTVSFAANGGNGNMDVQVFTENKSQSLTANGFSRSGHKFTGWATSAGSTTIAYADCAEISVSSNMVLYAVWEEIPGTPTSITLTNPEVTVTYGSFTNEDLLTLIAPKVMAEGAEVANAVVTINEAITTQNVGTYTVTLNFAGTDKNSATYYIGSSANATVTVEKATASVVVSSHTVKYPTIITSPVTANCKTIDILVGLDAHDETSLTGEVLVAIPDEMLTLLSLALYDTDIVLDDLSISDLETILSKVSGKNAELDALIEQVAAYKDTIQKLVDTLKKVQENLPMDTELKISVVGALTMPTQIGIYMIGSISADTNYTTDMDAGYLIISPNGIKAELSWNEIDDNNVITLSKLAGFDFGVTATVIESTVEGAILPDTPQDHVEYIFIGVDNNGNLLLDRCTDPDTVSLAMGAYAQVAYIANWDNEMYYAEPVVRPIVISPDVADVAILDVNGYRNYAQVFTYDGTPKPVTVTVNGQTNVDGLVVKYIGSDTTVDGWYREEAPTNAGVYTVVAVYTETDSNDELVTMGATLGVLIINPADADVALNDAEYCYDGNEHFAEITNEALDYITLAMDRENNIAYVNLPNDTIAHVNRLISMLPSEAQSEVVNILSRYQNFDGDVQTATIKAELTAALNKVIAVNLAEASSAKVEELVDALIAELSANEDVQALIAKLKSQLNTIKEEISSEIPDEIETKLIEYIKAVITVSDSSVDVDVATIKSDLKNLVAKLEGQLPQVVVDELYEMLDELTVAVEQYVDVDAVEAKCSELMATLEQLDAADAETLIQYIIGAAYGYADLDAVKALINEVIAKFEAQGYIDYTKNMVQNISGIYGKDIDTSEVEAAIDALVSKVEEKISTGSFDADDLTAVETYVDAILKSLISVVEQIPEGTIIFGQNPSAPGEYDCYAINISANYKAEFTSATLIITAITPAPGPEPAPDTGDGSNPGLWFILLIVSACAIITLTFYGKKEEE